MRRRWWWWGTAWAGRSRSLLAAADAPGLVGLGAFESPVPSLPGYRSDGGDLALCRRGRRWSVGRGRGASTGSWWATGPGTGCAAADRDTRLAEGPALVAELRDLRRPGGCPDLGSVRVPVVAGAGAASPAAWRLPAEELVAAGAPTPRWSRSPGPATVPTCRTPTSSPATSGPVWPGPARELRYARSLMPSLRSLTRRKPRVGLVLSGGGNLGAIQIGMLRALTEREIVPDVVLGCSVGALNGAGLRPGPHPGRCVPPGGALEHHVLHAHAVVPAPVGGAAHPQGRVAALQRRPAGGAGGPVRARSPVRGRGHPVRVRGGGGGRQRRSGGSPRASWCLPILASAALPAVFPPVVIDGKRYVDGGVLEQRPDLPGGGAGLPGDLRAARRRRTAGPTRRSAGRSTPPSRPTGWPATAASPGTWPACPTGWRRSSCRRVSGRTSRYDDFTPDRGADPPGLRELERLPGRARRGAGRAPPRLGPAASDRAAAHQRPQPVVVPGGGGRQPSTRRARC